MGYNIFVPSVMRIKGFRFFFFSNEAGEPIHIHVESDDKYAKFWIEPVHLAKSVGYSAKELRELRSLIVDNIETLKRSWHEYFGQ